MTSIAHRVGVKIMEPPPGFLGGPMAHVALLRGYVKEGEGSSQALGADNLALWITAKIGEVLPVCRKKAADSSRYGRFFGSRMAR
jgi:hypothetical protein